MTVIQIWTREKGLCQSLAFFCRNKIWNIQNNFQNVSSFMMQLFLFRNQNLWLWTRLVCRFWLLKYHPPKWLVFHRKWNVDFPLVRLKIKLLLGLNHSIWLGYSKTYRKPAFQNFQNYDLKQFWSELLLAHSKKSAPPVFATPEKNNFIPRRI